MDAATAKAWNASGFNITDYAPSHRQFRLSEDLTEAEITAALGIEPKRRARGKDEKVTVEWLFYAEKRYAAGDRVASVSTCCKIWDYQGARWSAYGFPEAFEQVGLKPLLTKDYGDWQYQEDGNPTIAILTALAAAARQGGDVKQAPGEAPQSGPKGNAQPLPGDSHG